MADLNYVLISGTVPKFNNVFRIFNKEDESRAVAHLSISCQTSRKNDNGYYVDDVFEVTAFGKTAVNLEKFANPGQGLWLVGRLTPTRKRRDKDGSDVLDANGRPIYTGMGFTAFSFGPTRNYAERNNNENGNNQSSSQSVAQAYNPFGDISAPQQPAPQPVQQQPAAKPSAGGSEDGWPFNGLDKLPF